MPPQCTSPRPKSAAVTRQVILESARRRFMQESYESVGMRDIAGDAEVDVALVSRYFGSKEDLFRQVLGIGSKEDILPEGVADTELANCFARLFMEHARAESGQGKEHLERLLIILRSASSPAASLIVREAFEEVMQPLADKLEGRFAEIRAGLSMAVWMGMTITRSVMAIEPLRDRNDEIEQRLQRLFAAALAE